MRNTGADGMMVFAPASVAAQPGDAIRFLPTDKSHNEQSIEGMFSDGAEAFRGPMNVEFSVTLDQEGVYGVECVPHCMIDAESGAALSVWKDWMRRRCAGC